MSRSKIKNFTSAPLAERVQRRRAERHGKPQVMRRRSVKEVNGKVTVVWEWVPVPTDGVARKVAARPTTRAGQRNVVPEKKSGGAK
jgi:hypothetical protein